MERTITAQLIKWKNSRRRKPLLMTGVRQCGKTYTVKEFGHKYFTNLIYLNFEENEALGDVFAYDFRTDRILNELSRYFHEEIIPGRTLIFFDEIQECPRAITALKYFCENEPELHVVCAGSLLGVALRSENISFPVGKVNRMQMFPMSFPEFVIASGEKELLEQFTDWPTDRPVPELYTRPMEQLLKTFFAVGGMPEAVREWVETHDISAVEEVQDEILRDYADDLSKHAPVREIEKIRWVWESIPKQLAKENNKFVFSHVKEGKRSAELEDSLQWLIDAGLALRLELVESPEIPLADAANGTAFKVYLSDVGLLRRRCGVSYDTLFEKNELFARHKGAMTENYVLNELTSLGKRAYFWRSGNTAELDFIFEENGSIIPLEVKAAENTQAKSYRQFCKKYHPAAGIKASMKNIAVNDCDGTKTISLPLYLLWNLDRYDR